MSNPAIGDVSQVEDVEEDNDYAKDDFGFIIGADGDLKSIMYPEHLMGQPPEEIKMILEIFGIDDFDQVENRVLH
jgi:hypothetical protein